MGGGVYHVIRGEDFPYQAIQHDAVTYIVGWLIIYNLSFQYISKIFLFSL